eukprot:g11356.t1
MQLRQARIANERSQFFGGIVSWIVPGLVGILTATLGSFIQEASTLLFTWRRGVCVTGIWKNTFQCCGHEVIVDFVCRAKLGTSPGEQHQFNGRLMTWQEIANHYQPTLKMPHTGSFSTVTGYLPAFDSFGKQFGIADAVWLASSVVLALVAALLCKYLAPAARGSGIPEVKAILGGFEMPAVLSARTLFAKIIGLTTGVAAGLTLGKEGPLVHVACCLANLLCMGTASDTGIALRILDRIPIVSAVVDRVKTHYASPMHRRELISAATAAGVSVAFGAPLGGVLFSFEEASTFFPQRTCARAFFAAVMAALMLMYLNPTGTHKLTLFQVTDTWKLDPIEYVFFCLLGVVGGCVGALFIKVNTWVVKLRLNEWWPKRVPAELEIFAIAIVTVLSGAGNRFMSPLMVDVIFRLFEPCDDFVHSTGQTEYVLRPRSPDEMYLCHRDSAPVIDTEIAFQMAVAGLLRFLTMCITFGAAIPAGLFVPSLFVGGAIGRLLGSFLYWAGVTNLLNFGDLLTSPITPSIYAIVGATAVLGGVCRVTISLVVIMFELTGALQHIVPFMLAAQFAKWTGDLFNDGIYDRHILLKSYLYLPEPEGRFTPGYAKDIVDLDGVLCISQPPASTLRMQSRMGYPLISRRYDAASDAEYHIFLGYVHARPLRERVQFLLDVEGCSPDTRVRFLETEDDFSDVDEAQVNEVDQQDEHPATVVDLSFLVDRTIIRVAPETPLHLAHHVFYRLGLRLVAVVDQEGRFLGLITKARFVNHVLSLTKKARRRLHHSIARKSLCSRVCGGRGRNRAESTKAAAEGGGFVADLRKPLLEAQFQPAGTAPIASR